jgi:hypothetical protein
VLAEAGPRRWSSALPAWTRAAARRAGRSARERRRLAAAVGGPVVMASDPAGLVVVAQLYNSRVDLPRRRTLPTRGSATVRRARRICSSAGTRSAS